MRGAWIEISPVAALYSVSRSLPVRGAWIEIATRLKLAVAVKSLPVRGAWIEMPDAPTCIETCYVAPRAGSVD